MIKRMYAGLLAMLIWCCGFPAAYAEHSFFSNPQEKSAEVHVILCYEPCLMEDVPFATREDLEAFQEEILEVLDTLGQELATLQERAEGLAGQVNEVRNEVAGLGERVDNVRDEMRASPENEQDEIVFRWENVPWWVPWLILLIVIGLLIRTLMSFFHQRKKRRQEDGDTSSEASHPRPQPRSQSRAQPATAPAVSPVPTNEWVPGAVRMHKVDKVDHQITLVRTKIKDGKPVRYYATEFTHGAVAENGVLEGEDLDKHLRKNRTP